MKIRVNPQNSLHCELCGEPGSVHLTEDGLISCERHPDFHLPEAQYDAETGRPLRVRVAA